MSVLVAQYAHILGVAAPVCLHSLLVGRTCEGPTRASMSFDLDFPDRGLLDRAVSATSDDRRHPALREPPRRFKFAAPVSYEVCDAYMVIRHNKTLQTPCHISRCSNLGLRRGLRHFTPIPYWSVSGCSKLKCRQSPILLQTTIARASLPALLITPS